MASLKSVYWASKSTVEFNLLPPQNEGIYVYRTSDQVEGEIILRTKPGILLRDISISMSLVRASRCLDYC
jgi:hypothetical protein